MHRAKELALLADIIDAPTAAEIGLVNRVLPDAELDAFVDDWAAGSRPVRPIALAMTKRLLNNSLNVTLEEALDDEGLSQSVNFGTNDTARGDDGVRREAAAHLRRSLSRVAARHLPPPRRAPPVPSARCGDGSSCDGSSRRWSSRRLVVRRPTPRTTERCRGAR